MARQTTVTVNKQDFTLQSVSPTWYLDNCDKYGIMGGKRNSKGYLDSMLKNCVVSPPEITAKGITYFDDTDDVGTPMALLSEIESFLKG